MQDSNRKRRRSSPPPDPTPACNKCRSRKIRCDRAKPECSSCRRAKTPCDFSASFKRTNPAKQLLRDFSSVAERLNDIDRSLARLSQQVESLTRTAPWSLFASSTADDGHDKPSSPPADGAITVEGGSSDATARNVLVTNGDGEQLHAYPAALCLFRASHKLLGAALGKLETGHTKTLLLQGPLAAAGQNPSLGQSLACHYETFPFRQRCTEPPITSDQLPISYPMQEFLYSLLDRYLSHINVHMPVFEASSIYASIETCYRADSADRNPAWAVCFHGIILLTSNLDSLVGQRAGFKTHSSEKTHDAISTSIVNCRRALANLDALSQPTLVNIQAFITLTLVAREFFLSSVYEKVCRAACALARTMGLSRSVSGMNEQTAQTRQRLFWILYALDKQRVFLSGQAPDMYLFDSDFQPPLAEVGTAPTDRLHAASLQLMSLWEDIYLGLYSARAIRSSSEQRRDQVRALDRVCNEWEQQHQVLLKSSSSNNTLGVSLMQMEAKYCYHVSKVLINRCDVSADGWQTTRDHALSALRSVTDVVQEPVSPDSCLVLRR
ncbi:predicted protein [Aspergillus terreus NIH2624]|uniref:Zn(2)-C6 fungal-type domain-containing protein n=1 Tax=Aspergillus terreus (strain NIH 2624 / FGSC A1156) TaxID=341663 RepID=Q0CQ67_ASPTN|nr:uncharacterized protein ATEG_04167 [Aspergillus terreus NIH2624]EAU35969.1 predicted protein [Aspergillus terreus NIH2624]